MKINIKLFYCFLFLLSPLTFGGDSKPVATECGSVLGKKYISMVTTEMLSTKPKWDPLVGPIPLPVDDACRRALEYANDKWNFHNVQDRLGQWEINTVSIGRVERLDWVYVVEILQRGPIQGVRRPMKIIVLLDGAVVQPKEAGRAIE